MPIRNANAQWDGPLREGKGTMQLGSGAWEGPYSFTSRFEEGTGSNPEELIGAAHAGCFSMQLAGVLGKGGHEPESVRTEARVRISKQGEGFGIDRIELTTRARVPGIDDATFQQAAQTAKEICPVSQALAAVPEITLDAALES